MSELKAFNCVESDLQEFCEPRLVYLKSEADKVIVDLEESHKKEVGQLLMEIVEQKNRIAPKQSDKTLQERLNEVCKKHAVSTLQDLDWAFCMAEAKLEDYTKLAADKHEALEKMLQYKVLYNEKCRDINTQERFFAMKVAHQKYKRCVALSQEWRSYATFCGMQSSYHNNRGFGKTAEHYTRKEIHAWKCVKRWLKIAEKFKEAK